MDADVAGDGADAAAHHHRRDVDLAPLQPLGAAHVVGVGPRPRRIGVALVPRQRPIHHDLLAELVEHQRAGERLVAGQGGDDVGLVALGRAVHIDAQLVRPARADRRPGDVSGRVQPPPQLADLLFQDRDGDAGGALDRGQHLPLRQRLQAGLDELPQDVTERLQIGRVGQRLRRGVELGKRAQGRRRGRLVERRPSNRPPSRPGRGRR